MLAAMLAAPFSSDIGEARCLDAKLCAIVLKTRLDLCRGRWHFLDSRQIFKGQSPHHVSQNYTKHMFLLDQRILNYRADRQMYQNNRSEFCRTCSN